MDAVTAVADYGDSEKIDAQCYKTLPGLQDSAEITTGCYTVGKN